MANEKAKIGKKEYKKLEQEFKAQKKELKEKPVLAENCLQVPPTDPQFGIYRLDKIRENVNDYFYEGKLVRVEEKDYQGCPYIYLVLKVRDEFNLVIPSALLAKTDLGEVSALLYKEHLGQRIQIKIRYEQNQAEPNNLKILEWQPLAFWVD